MECINQIIRIAIKKGLDITNGIRQVNINESQDNYYIGNVYICSVFTETLIESGYNEKEFKFYLTHTTTKTVLDKHATL